MHGGAPEVMRARSGLGRFLRVRPGRTGAGCRYGDSRRACSHGRRHASSGPSCGGPMSDVVSVLGGTGALGRAPASSAGPSGWPVVLGSSGRRPTEASAGELRDVLSTAGVQAQDRPAGRLVHQPDGFRRSGPARPIGSRRAAPPSRSPRCCRRSRSPPLQAVYRATATPRAEPSSSSATTAR